MKTLTLTAPLLALTTALSLAACTTEAEPVAPGAAGSTAPRAVAPSPVAAGSDPAAVLEVDDQTSEGPTVRVKLAAVTKGGFVVVGADKGSNILGFANVPASPTPATLQVSLADEVNKKTELVAMLFTDDNRSGLFDAGDRPVSNGKDDEDDDAGVFSGELEAFSFTGKPVVNS